MDTQTCKYGNCKGELRAKGWCEVHYWRWYRTGDPAGLRPPRSLDVEGTWQWYIERARVTDAGCIIWPGNTNSYGYGRFSKNRGHPDGVYDMAHRFAWERVNGPLGKLTIDHLCLVRDCVNVEHLEAVERAENTARMQRGLGRGEAAPFGNCPNCGHHLR